MKLWVGRVEIEIVVVAETEAKALRLISNNVVKEAENFMLPGDIRDVDEVITITDVAPTWRDSIPYGGDGELTVRELIESMRGPAAADDRTLPLF